MDVGWEAEVGLGGVERGGDVGGEQAEEGGLFEGCERGGGFLGGEEGAEPLRGGVQGFGLRDVGGELWEEGAGLGGHGVGVGVGVGDGMVGCGRGVDS